MPGRFSGYLATLAAFTIVAPISEASGAEFEGWKEMLAGAGLTGPAITAVGLASDSGTSPRADDDDLVRGVGIAEADTVVLAVGSHEPRKNHLALLQAAELCWRRGHEFTLVMVGGNSWDRVEFDAALAAARERGRRVVLLAGARDDVMWALYRRARFTVFPSLNEGFGLPVVESTSVGTPVITSDFGSMREIGLGAGALLVDPRDDYALTAALERLLTDDSALEVLRQEAAHAPKRSWAAYANDLWETFGLTSA